MASLLPPVTFREFDSNGDPLVGGKLYTYAAGTTTPLATYTDETGGAANTNPVILDADGRANVWAKPGALKFVLKDANDVTIYTIDNILPNDGAGGGILDSDYTYVGYSSRFGQNFTTTGLDNTLQQIFDMSGTSGRAVLKSGQQALLLADQTKTINIGSTLVSATYSVILVIENATDADPIFLQAIITAKTTTTFSIKLNAPTDSANYVVGWVIIG